MDARSMAGQATSLGAQTVIAGLKAKVGFWIWLAFYLFIVHMFTSERPFLPPGLFKDRNFASAIIMVFCVSSVMLATAALLAPYLQNLAGYPVYTAGWVMAPRGVGIIMSMFLAARMGMRVDQHRSAAGVLALLRSLVGGHFGEKLAAERSQLSFLAGEGRERLERLGGAQLRETLRGVHAQVFGLFGRT